MEITSRFTWERCLNAGDVRFDNQQPVYEHAVDGYIDVDPTAPTGALEELFARFNRGSGSDVRFAGPSMSVGDVVHLGETTWLCDSFGWKVHR